MARRSYSEQFKKDLVEESISSNRSIASIAEEHDLHPNVLRNWRKKYGGDAVVPSKRGRKKLTDLNISDTPNEDVDELTTHVQDEIEIHNDSDADEHTSNLDRENAENGQEKALLMQINRLATELRELKKHSPVAIFAENVNVYTDKAK